MRYFTFFLFTLFITQTSFSQEKYEREVRIKEKEVPKSALDFMKEINFSRKIRWYKEFAADKTSIEGKTKHKRKYYSIEFDTLGNIEDVEIQIKLKEIPSKTYKTIIRFFDEEYNNYSIEKIQFQYSGKQENLLKKIKTSSCKCEITTKYEWVISTKINGKYQKLEYLFSDLGNAEKKSTIILKNSDYLEY